MLMWTDIMKHPVCYKYWKQVIHRQKIKKDSYITHIGRWIFLVLPESLMIRRIYDSGILQHFWSTIYLVRGKHPQL